MSNDPDGSRTPTTVLLTGAGGVIGTMLRSRLATPGRTLRLVDTTSSEPGPGEEEIVGSVADRYLTARACAGVDAVVHLAGIPDEASWADILAVNVDATQAVLDAAARAGVPKVVLASSNHAVGMWTRDDDAAAAGLPADVAVRPDSFYGWSKAAGEALGRLYHERCGIDVVCLRIGHCTPRPQGRYGLSAWLSPDDAGRLVTAALDPAVRGYHVVWGVSANTDSWWSPAAGAAIGYHPRDDAADHRDAVLADLSDADRDPDRPAARRAGEWFADRPLGERSG